MSSSSPHPRSPSARWPWWSALGLLIFAIGLLTLLRDVELWNTLWYLHAWYGYLLVLDGLTKRWQGRSWLADRRPDLLAMLLWSVPFWYLYEAFNLRLQNWYYVFTHHPLWLQALFSALAFATVLPACVFHAELVRGLGWVERVRWRPRPVGRGVERLWLLLGVASIAAPLLWPRFAFPLVWGATLWLPDLANFRRGAPSFLGMIERGRPAPLLRLLVGGMAAGLAWEAFNYPARTRWIYTVPHFEEWKLFEMPVLGFFGFPVFALAAWSFSIFVADRLRGGRDWTSLESAPVESPGSDEAVAQAELPSRPRTAALLLVLAWIGCFAVLLVVRQVDDHARRPLLRQLPTLDEGAIDRLEANGVPTPERLVDFARRHPLAALAERTGIAESTLAPALATARLSLHKGMGVPAARLLEAGGVDDVSRLVEADVDELHRRLSEVAPTLGLPAPRRAIVAVWIRAAAPDGRPRR